MDNLKSVSATELAEVLERFLTKMVWMEYRRCTRELNGLNLTYPQFHTLLAIHRHNPNCTMGTLAEETNQVSATVTGIVDRLVERGLVARTRHPDDRRQVLVQLTDLGIEKLKNVFEMRRQRLMQVLAQIDAPQQAQLVAAFKQYIDVTKAVSTNGHNR